ncbi:YitT family protein [Vagococcus sp. DIV0080]|uniref:YitT family protein n=1 Tax=Candidatus Vagococcus giribetii TaxID=2230876 RepID=A0ABS3HSZ4_9ENTE|nr:YitT family protein [Vagococcus sp. DIV0080]MBO0476839.1 YitT family protein [Vagococcus sp. DIV0080]
MKKTKQMVTDIIFIFLGASIYSFGLVTFNMPNQLAEGGITGITLIIYNLFGLNPAYTTLLLNIPLILIGLRIFGFKALIYTLIGTFSLSFNILFWQQMNISVSVEHDLLIAALLAGLIGGIGSGLIYRVGGTTGGTDIIARILEKNFGLTIGRSLLMLDIVVLLLSLSYLSLKQMMYTLIAVFVFSIVVDFVQEASYSAKGILVISDKNELIAACIMEELERGVTYLKSEGAYSHAERNIIFCVATHPEINRIKEMAHEIDKSAFVSILTVNEVIGEGFSKETIKHNKAKKKKEQA